jgi:hypothetical protein
MKNEERKMKVSSLWFKKRIISPHLLSKRKVRGLKIQ